MNDSMILCMEVLPNEFWLTIFSSIHIGDITRAFLRLNNCITNLVYSLPSTVYHYEMGEYNYNRRIHTNHISVRDGRSFSYHLNGNYLVWLSLDRPSQRQLQFLQSTYFPRLKHLHFNGIGTINNNVAQFYYTIFNPNRAKIPSLISCSLPSISSLNWNYFNQRGSAINHTLRSLTLIDDYHLQSYEFFRSVPNLTHLTIKRDVNQNESFIDITRQFNIRRKYVLTDPEDEKMNKVKCSRIPEMFNKWLPHLRRLKFEFELDPNIWKYRNTLIVRINWKQNSSYLPKIYRLV